MHRPGESYARAELDGEAFDTIVIGSGVGGLMTAVLLTRYAGRRVLVLERHYVAGGFTHSFARPGYDWDVGVHYIGDVLHPQAPTRRLFDVLTDGEVAWASMGDVYDRIFVGDDVYDYRAGLREWKEQMLAYFPREEAAIDGWITAVKQVSSATRRYFAEKALPDPVSRVAGRTLRASFLEHSSRTTREVLDELTDDERLKTVLSGQWGDHGLPPRRSSFAMHAIVTNHYFRGGAFPVGGASAIPAAATRQIEAAGGRVLVGAEVERILVDRGRVRGVQMVDGREFTADEVVSNAGVHVTYGQLLDDEVARDIGAPKLLDRVPPSLGHLSLYVGLDASDDELGTEPANRWLYQGDDHDAHVDAFLADPDAPLPLTYLSFPSRKDPDFRVRHPGHATIDVIVPAPTDWFAEWDGTRWRRRGEAYEQLKAEFTERLLAQVHAHVPEAKNHVDVAELSTPLSTRHFTNYPAGELYGIDHTAERFDQRWLRPRTPIRGLYLTGQDIMTAGVASALASGALTASAMAGLDLAAHAIRSRLPGG